MLEELHVRNIALIRELEVGFSDHLNILSGETGAGKSILLGSVNLALGLRGGSELLRTGESEALVELVFSVTDPEVLKNLQELQVEPEDGKLILSRRISEKRSILRLNGETVPVSFVRQISPLLIDIHGQHEHQSLLSEEQHLRVLDGYGKAALSKLLPEYREAYRAYRDMKKKISDLGGSDDEERERRLGFLEFQLQEIEDAGIREGEEACLTEEQKKLSSAEEIREGLSMVSEALSGNAADGLSQAIQRLQQLSTLDRELQPLLTELRDIESLMQDASVDAKDRLSALETDGERLHFVDERLTELSRLKRKYGNSETEILKTAERLQHEYDELKNFSEHKEELQKSLSVLQKKLVSCAEKLHEARLKTAQEFEREMKETLQDLNFMRVDFKAEVTKTSRFTSAGADEVRFMISTNPGEPLKPLSKVASGGELSRIMLAIKTLSADSDRIETLIFDEIDQGISGKTAAKVAEKMRKIAGNHQVICISHLPQIVAAADHHFLIEKTEEDGSAVTGIRELSEDASIEELSRLLGASDITEAGRENAREMKQLIHKQ